jgi:hypothetical protein
MRWWKATLITLAAVVLLFGYELIAVRGTFVRVCPATDVGGKALNDPAVWRTRADKP